MPDKDLEKMVRSAVDKALEQQLSSLRESVIERVVRDLSAKSPAKAGQGSAASLQKAIAAIHAGSTQKEILRALLENTMLGSSRAALFVVKGGAATGWQGTGFESDESIKDSSLDITSGLPAAAIQSRCAESGKASDVDPGFISEIGKPADGNAVVLPLLLKDKISALVYADGGTEQGSLDVASLDILVRATSTWLELISQRKLAQREVGAEAIEAAQAFPAVNDPFAAHAPLHSAKAQAIPQVESEEEPAAMAVAAGAGAGSSSKAGMSHEDGEIHKKAQRFARLLMDEIKLYNQAKLAEGRKHKDLYDRLKEDIEKSRATYQKRYGNTAAGSADYFNQELIRSLAEDDVSLLGSNFRR